MSKYTFQSSQLHGLGLFAGDAPIAQGERIHSETPNLNMDVSLDQLRSATFDNDFAEQLRQLPQPDVSRLRLLAVNMQLKANNIPSGGFVGDFQGNFPNAHYTMLTISQRVGIRYTTAGVKRKGWFKDLCMLNHSCLPNAERYWNEVEQMMELRATQDIASKAEILVSYTDNLQPRKERHKSLGFECKCSACTLHGEDLEVSEGVLRVIRELVMVVQQFETKYLKRYEMNSEEDKEVISAINSDEGLVETVKAAGKVIRLMADIPQTDLLLADM